MPGGLSYSGRLASENRHEQGRRVNGGQVQECLVNVLFSYYEYSYYIEVPCLQA